MIRLPRSVRGETVSTRWRKVALLCGIALAASGVAVHAGAVDVVRAANGKLSVVDVLAEEGTLIWVNGVAPGDEPAVFLAVSGQGAWRVRLDPAGTDVLLGPVSPEMVVDDVPSAWPEASQPRVRAVLAGLLDAAAERLPAEDFPAELRRLRAALATVSSAPVHLRVPGAGGTTGCIGRDSREECDRCCDNEWQEARDDCRKSFDAAGRYSRLDRCITMAARRRGLCSLSCALLPSKPGGRP